MHKNTDNKELITHELLKEWNACEDGYKRFCELFPESVDLETAIKGLLEDGHDEWGYWLFNQCRKNNLFKDYINKGYLNSGDRNSGDRNSGDRNSGDLNSGDLNSGNWNSGDRNSGDLNSGDLNSGDVNSGYRNSGDRNSGDLNSGDLNSGNRNSGDRNSGDLNSGDLNSGDRNSGNRNSGNRNSGNLNSGNWNSGNLNSGNLNSGNWNSGDRNSGFFNTITPEKILIFNKLCEKELWENAYKPKFLLFDLTYWVDEPDMTDKEKASDPNFYTRGGQLRIRDYKEAFKLSWQNADKEDRIKVKELPNFDKDVFYEISGIDVDKD